MHSNVSQDLLDLLMDESGIVGSDILITPRCSFGRNEFIARIRGAAIDFRKMRGPGYPSIFEGVIWVLFLSARITVGTEIDSTTCRTTSSSASSRSVLRAWPVGSSQQVICCSRASFSPLCNGGFSGWLVALAPQCGLQALLDEALAYVEQAVHSEHEDVCGARSSLLSALSAPTCSSTLVCLIL